MESMAVDTKYAKVFFYHFAEFIYKLMHLFYFWWQHIHPINIAMT